MHLQCDHSLWQEDTPSLYTPCTKILIYGLEHALSSFKISCIHCQLNLEREYTHFNYPTLV